jgi:hypothetical protein
MRDFEIQSGKHKTNNPRPRSRCKKCCSFIKRQREKLNPEHHRETQRISYQKNWIVITGLQNFRRIISQPECPLWAKLNPTRDQILQFFLDRPQRNKVALIEKSTKYSSGLWVPWNMYYGTPEEISERCKQSSNISYQLGLMWKRKIRPSQLINESRACSRCSTSATKDGFSKYEWSASLVCYSCKKLDIANAVKNRSPEIRAHIRQSQKEGQTRKRLIRTTERETLGFKTCFECRRDMLLSDFLKVPKAGDGYNNRCEVCRKRKVYTDRILPEFDTYEMLKYHYFDNGEDPELLGGFYLYTARKKRATPPWARVGRIKKRLIEIRKNKQKNISIDHLYPIRGRNSCGLNVPWNLRYTTRVENSQKHNRDPLPEEIEQHLGKDL